MAIEIVDFAIKNGDLNHSSVSHYQRVSTEDMHRLCGSTIHCLVVFRKNPSEKRFEWTSIGMIKCPINMDNYPVMFQSPPTSSGRYQWYHAERIFLWSLYGIGRFPNRSSKWWTAVLTASSVVVRWPNVDLKQQHRQILRKRIWGTIEKKGSATYMVINHNTLEFLEDITSVSHKNAWFIQSPQK